MKRVFVTVIAISVLATLTPASAAPVCVPIPAIADRCEDWLVSSDFADMRTGGAADVSPDGTKALTVGISYDVDFRGSWALDMRDTATGTSVWTRNWSGLTADNDFPYDLVFSPDGEHVYVTGIADTDWHDGSAGVASFSASTGATEWQTFGSGTLAGMTYGRRLDVSADGSTLVVAGTGHDGEFSDAAYEVYGIDTATGDIMWQDSYHQGPGATWGVAISHGNAYVTGIAGNGFGGNYVFGTVAYDMITGERIWTSSYEGGFAIDGAEAIAISPDGSRIFLTGWSQVATGGTLHPRTAFTVVALAADDGDQLWVSKHEGFQRGMAVGRALAVTPDGSTVIASGDVLSEVPEQSWDPMTVAFDAATGTVKWSERYDIPGRLLEQVSQVALSPDGDRYYLTAISRIVGATSLGQDPSDAVTLAYDVATGARVWTARLNATVIADSTTAAGLAVSDSGVFVSATSSGNDGHLQALLARYAL